MAGHMRTNVLRAALLAALLVLAGCNGGGGATTTAPQQTLASNQSPEPTTDTGGTATPPGSAGSSGVDPRTAQDRRFLELAEANDVPVSVAVTQNGTFNVVYEVQNDGSGVSRRGFRVAQAYATLVNDTWHSNASWNATAMEATAVTENGTPVSSYRMPAYWGYRLRTQEVFTDSWLGTRLDGSSARVYANGSIANISDNLTQFGAGLGSVQNGTVTQLTRRGGTVFVTLETETENRTLLESRLARTVVTYGAFAYRDWDPERVELEVVRPDGDTYGWYHIKRIRALNAYRNQATQPIIFARETFEPENDALDGRNASG
jgi:hypothetical protein